VLNKARANVVKGSVSIRTIALTLKPTDQQVVALHDLLATCNAACNAISQVAWERQEFHQLTLQKVVYRDVPQYLDRLQAAGVQISMHRPGQALDNIFTERLWRTVKYEEV
jgi:hypothetical protein